MQAEPVIRVDRLTKRYGEFTALDELSWAITPGQILGLLGPNGAGKTTTIRILVGQLRPTSGAATIAGVDCTSGFKQIKRLVGYMPDVFGTYDNMRVHEYLDFFGAAFSIPRQVREDRLRYVLELTGTASWKDQFVESLSHGMKQRVAVARTLMHDPQVLILDEPANGLDPTARIEMRHLLRRLADGGKTLIVSSHILPELARICDLVAILAGGRLRAFGTVDDIMARLRQRRMFEVLVPSADALQPAQQLLSELLLGDAPVDISTAERVLRFETSASDQQISELLGKLVVRGIAVSQFREVVGDLEDAFLSITTDDGGQQVAEGHPPCST